MAASRSRRNTSFHFPAFKTWQLVIIFILLSFMSATLLRLNNLGMDARRSAVIEADKAGNPERTKAALAELQRYVSSHMNTDLDKGVYLEESYRRDYAAAVAAAASAPSPNSQAYQQAYNDCHQPRYLDYVQCVSARIEALPEGHQADAKLPNPEAYRHDYASPSWSADLAGLSVALTLLTGLAIIVRVLLYGVARLLLKRHYRQLSS